MAPSRRKGAGKAAAAGATRKQWKFGDLVLAKVKGFPAWPAEVSEPEKWGYSSDWKKVLVCFFGTQQIAFCNPADVEAFTEEKKQSLLTKRHGKGSDFVRAVKEIIESYEKLKNQEQADDQKSANEMAPQSGGKSAEELQVHENPLVASLDTQSKSNSAKDGVAFTLLSEDASAAEQILALRDNDTASEQIIGSVTNKETPKIATYSSRKRRGGVRSQKSVLPKEASLLQQTKSASRVELHRSQSSMLPYSDCGQCVDDMNDGAIRKRKRVRRYSSASQSDDVGSLALHLSGSDEENASEIAIAKSDNISTNEGNGLDSNSKLEYLNTIVECLESDLELKTGLDFQIKAIIVKKKRKPTRKRIINDAAELPANVDAKADLETGVSNTFHSSQNSGENLIERPSKENGDEHLPLVKRARVRMSRTFYTDDEINTSSQIEDRFANEAAVNASRQATLTSDHDTDILSGCESFAEKELVMFCPVLSAKATVYAADVLSSAEKGSFENTSLQKPCIEIFGNEPEASKVTAHEFNNSPNDEAVFSRSKQFSSSSGGEAALPSSKIYAMEAISPSAAEEVQACSGASSTIYTLIDGSDIPAAGCSQETNMIETRLDLGSVDTFENNASQLCSALYTSTSEEPVKCSARGECQKRSRCEDSLVRSVDCLNDKCHNNAVCLVQTEVQSQKIELSPSDPASPSMTKKSEAANFQLREEPGSPIQVLDTSNQMNTNLVFSANEVEVLPQDGEPHYDAGHCNCENTEPLKPQVYDSNQPSNMCQVVEETKDQFKVASSVSANGNHSCEKDILCPADISDSPARGTPHSNSVCHISTAESANDVQIDGSCSPNVHFHEKRSFRDAVVEGETIITAVPERPKSTGLSSNYVEMHSALLLFEGMLGSLVRTKESIGRATRLALDCAKLGVSAKVMEILANSLESESNLQRRVDLFFLVDSVAQCSKGLKCDAGGVYLSTIQAMLPRLLFAAAPPGSTTQENRRQCLKVLRLWLERRILPESVIQHHIRELDSHCSSLSACLYSRRSARTERPLDDPVRDMEGMLVDEYGSNSTLQFPGFCMPSMLKDENEGSDSDGGDFEAVTPEHHSTTPEEQQQVVTSTAERHTHILEDVDGELEMEDVAPSCEVGMNRYNNAQVDTTRTSDNHFGQRHRSIPATSSQDLPSSSPMLRPSPHPLPPLPRHPAQCAMSDSYSNGFDHGRYPGGHPGGASRINPTLPANTIHPTNNMPHTDGPNFQRMPPYPPCPPPHPQPPSQFPCMQPGHHIKSRRDPPPYSHRSHYMSNHDDWNFYDNHERMRPGPYESRDNWRHPPPSSYGPRYHDRPKVPYGSGSYSRPPHEPARFPNQRWNHSHRPFNNHRNSFHYKPHSEGPVPVGTRDPGTWHQR